jgi:inner membrane protein
MDNITHSLVGLGVGELVHRSLPPEADARHHGTRRRLLLTGCALASNFPDLDLLLTRLLPAPLGYLLNHRGHTHTLLWAVPQALLLCALLWLLWPGARALLKASRPARLGLAVTVVLGFGLHLGMDFLNSYGLHPFAPFDGHWFYGDTLFIIEPVFWILFGVPLALTLHRPMARYSALGLLTVALVFFTAQAFLSWYSLVALVVLGLVLARLQWRSLPQARGVFVLALLLGIGFVGAQATVSALGKQRIASALVLDDPASRLLDVAMTAFPANPLCWTFVSVESNEQAGTYRLRRGVLSMAPERVPAAVCPAGLVGPVATGRTPPGMAPQIVLLAQESDSLTELRQQQLGNCYFAAWMRFARAPSLTGGVASDYRFDAGQRGNFSTLRLADFAGRACPAGVPQWSMPRADMLAPQGAQLAPAH